MRLLRESALLALGTIWLAAWAAAQTGPSGQVVPSNAFDITRTTQFQYNDPQAYLTDQIVEPNDPQSCVQTTIGYDAWGNKDSVTTKNCTTGGAATGDAVITDRTATSNFANLAGQAGIVGGQYPYQIKNALLRSENRKYDIRFGAVISDTDPNLLNVQVQYDAFGRKILEIRPDSTRTAWTYAYCVGFDPRGSSYGASCPAATTGTLVSVTTQTPQDKNGAQSGPPQRTYFDTRNRVARTETLSFDGSDWIVKVVGYDALGNVTKAAEPYLDTSPPTIAPGSVVWTTSLYDVLHRVYTISKPDPTASGGVAVTSVNYDDLVTVTTNPNGQTVSETRDSQGQVVAVVDTAGGVLVRQFDALGNMLQSVDQLGNASTAHFDLRSRKYSANDPDLGAWTYGYDVLGELVWQESPNQALVNKKTSLKYDVLGRVTQRVVDEYMSTWTYDQYATGTVACSDGIGRLCEASTTQGDDRKYTFDSFGRPKTETLVNAGGPTFVATTGYDTTTGRLSSVTYPTGVAVNYVYNPTGYFAQVNNAADGKMIWQANAYTARGQLQLQTFGNNVQTQNTFEAHTGRITNIQVQPTGGTAGTLVNLVLGWDPIDNLTARTDENGNGGGVATGEAFQYDSLNRLHDYSVTSPAIAGGSRNVIVDYDAIGNITSKSDVPGTYTYPPSGGASVRPHAVSSVGSASYHYDANGNMISGSGTLWSGVAYTSFNLPNYSSNGGLVSAVGVRYKWQYGPDLQRLREDRVTSTNTRTTWFFHPDNAGGLFFEQETEVDGSIVNRHFINAGGQVVAVFASTGVGSATITRKDYWHSDHLGSLVAVTGATGALVQHYAYDPFGKRRFVNGNFDGANALFIDWTHYADENSAGALITGTAGSSRGFTGHESLDDVGLINMNGRLYDATIGRFMQADPTVQFTRAMQDYNRYSYLMNNPLNARDPSGFSTVFHIPYRDWNGPASDNPVTQAQIITRGTEIFNDSTNFFPMSSLSSASNFYVGWLLAPTLGGGWTLGNGNKGGFLYGPGSSGDIAATFAAFNLNPPGQDQASGKGVVGANFPPEATGERYDSRGQPTAQDYLFNDNYSADRSGWHEYTTVNEVCPAALVCSTPEMADQSRRFAVPGQDPSKPVENGGIYEVFDPRTGLFVGDVRTRVSDDNLTISNTTLPGHLLYDGRITRTTWQDETGAWYVDTHGMGNNVIPGMNTVNQWQGPKIFDYVDSQMRCSISMHHGLGC